MIRLEEGDLRVTLPGPGEARKFDDPLQHGLSHCMKAVDFVVEFERSRLFLEIKDPEHPRAQPSDQGSFVREFQSSQLDGDLVQKYRDSFVYEWACGRLGKPVHYWVLVGIDSLGAPDLLARTDALKSRLPCGTATESWLRPVVTDCRVFTPGSWNRTLPDGYMVTRLSA